MTSAGPLELLYGRPLRIDGAKYFALPFGDDLKGDLYMPDPMPKQKMPIVIWLHGYSHSTGYSRYGRPFIAEYLKRGMAVFAFDHIGYGTRIHSMKPFYERHPHWSLLGRMVLDTRAAISAVAALDSIDAQRIMLAGQSLGATVALFTSALDPRVNSVTMFGGFTPLRQTKPDDGTEGVRMYSHLHGLLPRLGAYIANPATLPIDFDDVLNAATERNRNLRIYLIAPVHDRYASLTHVKDAVRGNENVTLVTPDDFFRFPLPAARQAADWLTAQPAR